MHTSIEVVKREVGRWNTDIALGWETGLKGKERTYGGRLFEREPPKHFYEEQNRTRLNDWQLGKEKAERYRKEKLLREVHFMAENNEGQVKGKYKGWSVKRGEVINRLVKNHGCYGEVYFYYCEGTQIVRTHKCGI